MLQLLTSFPEIMNKQTYLSGGYPLGSSKYRMALKKFGPIPAPVAPVPAPVEPVVEEKVEVQPVPIKKAVKKVAKKKSED